jgi:hypothetical protein
MELTQEPSKIKLPHLLQMLLSVQGTSGCTALTAESFPEHLPGRMPSPRSQHSYQQKHPLLQYTPSMYAYIPAAFLPTALFLSIYLYMYLFMYAKYMCIYVCF